MGLGSTIRYSRGSLSGLLLLIHNQSFCNDIDFLPCLPTHLTHLRPELFHINCGDFKAFRWGRVARDIYRAMVNLSSLPPLLNSSGSSFIAAGRERMVRLVVFPDEGTAVQVNGTIEFRSGEALRRLSLRRLDPTGTGPHQVVRPVRSFRAPYSCQ